MVPSTPRRLERKTWLKRKLPEKLQNLFERIKDCIKTGNYIFTAHALERQNERVIDTLAALYVLKNGYEEKRKTHFDVVYNTWKYAIRGKTVDELDIRVIAAFDEKGMIVITVMHVL